jgi:hypothetical protein
MSTLSCMYWTIVSSVMPPRYRYKWNVRNMGIMYNMSRQSNEKQIQHSSNIRSEINQNKIQDKNEERNDIIMYDDTDGTHHLLLSKHLDRTFSLFPPLVRSSQHRSCLTWLYLLLLRMPPRLLQHFCTRPNNAMRNIDEYINTIWCFWIEKSGMILSISLGFLPLFLLKTQQLVLPSEQHLLYYQH